MSAHNTQTTRNTTGSNSSVETSSETGKVIKEDYRTKPVLDSMEDYYKFEAYMQRPDFMATQKKCTVTPEIFDILAQGQETPFLWIKNIQVFNSETKDKAMELLNRKQSMVVM